MAVHVPLSVEAQVEARVLMMSTNNILSPADGRPVINPTQDIVLGTYWLTRIRPGAKGTGRIFSNVEQVIYAYENNLVDLQAAIKVRINGRLEEASVGRALMADVVPEGVPFDVVNRVMDKKALANFIDTAFRKAGAKSTVILADKLMQLGFKYSTMAGISICVDDLKIPDEKKTLLESASRQVQEIQHQYDEGLITNGERYNRVVDIWTQTSDKVAKEMMRQIERETIMVDDKPVEGASFNPIFIMANSGARGSAQQIRQLAGMRGLLAKPSGEIIETPITANFREGLSVLQYFISSHGARKGLADMALKTANSGYLTRCLVDVAQDIIVSEVDCGTDKGMEVMPLMEGGEIIQPLVDRVLGRTALESIVHPGTSELILPAGEEVDESVCQRLTEVGIEKVKIRSALTCKTRIGVCVKCYGRDLARGNMVNLGEAVGIIAAQSIGEPGTQLTMRTFHLGGTASRAVEQSIHVARVDGTIRFEGVNTVENRYGTLTVMARNGEMILFDEYDRREKALQGDLWSHFKYS